jgi:hypothetical protein
LGVPKKYNSLWSEGVKTSAFYGIPVYYHSKSWCGASKKCWVAANLTLELDHLAHMGKQEIGNEFSCEVQWVISGLGL